MKFKIVLFVALILVYFSTAEENKKNIRILPAIDVHNLYDKNGSVTSTKENIKIVPGLAFFHPSKDVPSSSKDPKDDKVFKVMSGVTLQRIYDDTNPQTADEELNEVNMELVPRLVFYHPSDIQDLDLTDNNSIIDDKFRVLPGVSIHKKEQYKDFSRNNIEIVPNLSFYRKKQEAMETRQVMADLDIEEMLNLVQRLDNISPEEILQTSMPQGTNQSMQTSGSEESSTQSETQIPPAYTKRAGRSSRSLEYVIPFIDTNIDNPSSQQVPGNPVKNPQLQGNRAGSYIASNRQQPEQREFPVSLRILKNRRSSQPFRNTRARPHLVKSYHETNSEIVENPDSTKNSRPSGDSSFNSTKNYVRKTRDLSQQTDSSSTFQDSSLSVEPIPLALRRSQAGNVIAKVDDDSSTSQVSDHTTEEQ